MPGALSAAETSQPFTIVSPEAGAAPVVIAPTASELTRTNAEELARIIEQMTGNLPAVATEPPAGPAIVAGTAVEFPDTPRLRDLQGRSPEAFLLHSAAGRLHIVGNSDLGVQAGIFTLLRQLGCRWFFPHEAWTVMPEPKGSGPSPSAAVPAPPSNCGECHPIWPAIRGSC